MGDINSETVKDAVRDAVVEALEEAGKGGHWQREFYGIGANSNGLPVLVQLVMILGVLLALILWRVW